MILVARTHVAHYKRVSPVVLSSDYVDKMDILANAVIPATRKKHDVSRFELGDFFGHICRDLVEMVRFFHFLLLMMYDCFDVCFWCVCFFIRLGKGMDCSCGVGEHMAFV